MILNTGNNGNRFVVKNKYLAVYIERMAFYCYNAFTAHWRIDLWLNILNQTSLN